MINMYTFEKIVDNPFKYVEDESVEDNLLEEDNIDVFLKKYLKIRKNVVDFDLRNLLQQIREILQRVISRRRVTNR